MSKEINMHDEEEMTVTLTFDDGTEEECIVLDIFTVEELGDQEYIALLSLPENVEKAEEDEVEGEILLYRYEELEGEEISLDSIDDEKEAEMVERAYQNLLEEEEEE